MTPDPTTTTRPKNPQNTQTTIARVFRKLTRSGRRSADAIRKILLDDGRNHAVESLRDMLQAVPGLFVYVSCMFTNGFSSFEVAGCGTYPVPPSVQQALTDWYATIRR